METILDTMFRFASETKAALEQAITSSNEKVSVEKGEKTDKSKKGGVGDVLGRTLKHVSCRHLFYSCLFGSVFVVLIAFSSTKKFAKRTK